VEDNEDIEVVRLEDEWEDFEPQVLKSAAETESEKGTLRDEMKDILADFRSFQPANSSTSSKSASHAHPSIEDDEIQVLQSKKSVSDDDEIVVIQKASTSKAEGKKKAPSSSQTFWNCLVCFEQVSNN
jgi:hypothetical protein